MPLFGAHKSIAGGYHKALNASVELEAQSVQLFTKNNNQWRAKPITQEEIATFQKTLKGSQLQQPLAHNCYLINLASPDEALFRKSVDAFTEEVERAEMLGLSYLVMHPGCPTDGNDDAGLQRIARALDEVHSRCPQANVMILLETTAGQGCSLGHRFEHLAWILDHVQDPDRLGVCLDTCHIFAAGYSLYPLKEYRKTFREFDKTVGVDKLKAFHVNDSKKPQGSRVDRHEHIGQGHIGLEAFRLLVNDSRFRKHPMILETPKEGPNDEDMDLVNIARLRGLVEK